MRLMTLAAAQAELEKARDYYLEHATPRIAEAFVDDYEHSVTRILNYPQVGALRLRQLRALPFQHFPHSIIYRFAADIIVVTAVAHHSRRPEYWSNRH